MQATQQGPVRIHVLEAGRAICGILQGLQPKWWPKGHVYVSRFEMAEARTVSTPEQRCEGCWKDEGARR